MGDASSEAPEGREFQLLGLLGNLGQVFKEHQDLLLILMPQGDEARLQGQARAGNGQAGRAQAGVVSPQLQAFDQGGGVIVELLAHQIVHAQQVQRAFVGQLHPTLRVKHQDAGAHALQDQGVERFQADHFAGALLGQGFTGFQSSGQALYQQRGGKTQCPQGAGLQVTAGTVRVAQAKKETRADDAEGGQGRDQQADAAAQQCVADGHRDNEQVADGTGYTTRGEEQPREQQHISQGQAEQPGRAAGVLKEHHQQDIQHQVQPAATAQQVILGEGQQLVVHVAGNQQYEGDADA
ncbi:hypothetical protein D3C78_1101960 [compost metagenome]